MFLYTRQTKTVSANAIINEFGDIVKSVMVAGGDSITTDVELNAQQLSKLKEFWNNDEVIIEIQT